MAGPLGLDPRLWDLLVCPGPDHGALKAEGDEIVCTVCASRFRVEDGIPVMLLGPTEG